MKDTDDLRFDALEDEPVLPLAIVPAEFNSTWSAWWQCRKLTIGPEAVEAGSESIPLAEYRVGLAYGGPPEARLTGRHTVVLVHGQQPQYNVTLYAGRSGRGAVRRWCAAAELLDLPRMECGAVLVHQEDEWFAAEMPWEQEQELAIICRSRGRADLVDATVGDRSLAFSTSLPGYSTSGISRYSAAGVVALTLAAVLFLWWGVRYGAGPVGLILGGICILGLAGLTVRLLTRWITGCQGLVLEPQELLLFHEVGDRRVFEWSCPPAGVRSVNAWPTGQGWGVFMRNGEDRVVLGPHLKRESAERVCRALRERLPEGGGGGGAEPPAV
jgi:hypothetical protein